MSSLKKYIKDEIVYPGKTLEETLDFLNLTQKSLASKTDLTVKHINNIIKGKASITPETAMRLESVLGVSADFWSSLERNYQLSVARLEYRSHVISESKNMYLYKDTCKELMDKKILPKLTFIPSNMFEITSNFLKLHRAFSLNSITGSKEVVFRRYAKKNINYDTINSVIVAAERKAENIDTEVFNSKKLESSLHLIKNLSNQNYLDYMPKIESILASCGVALVSIPGFKSTGIQGISKWLSKDKVMLVLKTDGQTSKTSQYEDILFFNLFHEIAHILKHSKMKTFLDLEDRVDSTEEIEADMFASDVLMPGFKKEEMKGFSDIDKAIKSLSKKYGVSNSIVAGQLSHLYKSNNTNVFKILNSYRAKVKYANYLVT